MSFLANAIFRCAERRWLPLSFLPKLLVKHASFRAIQCDAIVCRELKRMDGMLHDLFTNCTDVAIGHLTDWVLYQTDRA